MNPIYIEVETKQVNELLNLYNYYKQEAIRVLGAIEVLQKHCDHRINGESAFAPAAPHGAKEYCTKCGLVVNGEEPEPQPEPQPAQPEPRPELRPEY